MHFLITALRLIHIALGVFWAGTIFFVATFLEPSVRAAGPGGAPVMLQLKNRHYFEIVPAIAALAILSGLGLFWLDSSGFAAIWVRSPMGLSLSVGGVATIVAFVVGVSVMRPAVLRLFVLGQSLQQLPEGEARQARMAELQVLRMRAATLGRWVAALLAVGVAAMAIARYL